MPVKLYVYENCGTCRKAKKFLDAHGIDYRKVPIREQPPTTTDLSRMLGYVGGDIKKLFNTSGGDYKSLKLKDKLPRMSDKAAIDLLHSNGNLVKRPFVLTKKGGTVGFKDDVWKTLFL